MSIVVHPSEAVWHSLPMRSLSTMFVAVGCVLIASLTACSTGKQLPKTALDSSGGQLFNGYVKEDVKCFSCHNGDGKGANGPNLAERIPKLSDEAILKAINDGPSYMPSFKDKLTEDEKKSLVQWMRASFGGPS